MQKCLLICHESRYVIIPAEWTELFSFIKKIHTSEKSKDDKNVVEERGAFLVEFFLHKRFCVLI